MKRRELLSSISALGLVAWSPALFAAPAGVRERRIQNRLELRGTYARKTERLLARYSTTRESSLLIDPLITAGSLAYRGPNTLVMRDDDLDGVVTRITEGHVSLRSNASDQIARQAGEDWPEGTRRAPANWLAERLVRLFAPGDGSALVAGCRVDAPKGRLPRLELLPPRDSDVRRELRALTIGFDPVGGAVVELIIDEAQGDRVRIKLTDHRQNPPAEDVDRVIEGG